MRMIEAENIPCLYELSWDRKTLAIILRIHKDVEAFIKSENIPFNDQTPIAICLKEQFKFQSFKGNLNGNIGFDDSFTFSGKKDEFFEFIIKIPQVKKITNEKCNECKGSGKGKDNEEKCLYCQGTGKRYKYDWGQAYAISASFTAILTLLSIFDCKKKTSASFPQLLTLQTRTDYDIHGGSLGGTFSMALRKWLNSLEFGPIPEIIQAMKEAYNQMLGLTEYNHLEFRANIDNEKGWLNIDCPGDATGLNPECVYIKKDEGYRFGCHNVDTPVQQITLIAGLAALYDRAKKEIGPG